MSKASISERLSLLTNRKASDSSLASTASSSDGCSGTITSSTSNQTLGPPAIARPSPIVEEGSDTDSVKLNRRQSISSFSSRRSGVSVGSGEKRVAEFVQSFGGEVGLGEVLVASKSCALQKDILVHGRLFASTRHLAFASSILGYTSRVVIPFSEIEVIERRFTALVIPNA